MHRTIPDGSSLCDTKGKLRIFRAYAHIKHCDAPPCW